MRSLAVSGEMDNLTGSGLTVFLSPVSEKINLFGPSTMRNARSPWSSTFIFVPLGINPGFFPAY